MKKLSQLLICSSLVFGLPAASLSARAADFDGLDVNLGNLYRTSKAQSRSISPENFTGEKGKAGMATEGTGKNAARELGQTWKVSPSVLSLIHILMCIRDSWGSFCRRLPS